MENHRTWEVIKRDSIPLKNGVKPNIISSTWAFKIKRFPDGRLNKFRARFCVRGDRQVEGVDYFETYDPVASWSSIRMLLIMSLQHGWTTKQIDFSNAFFQGTLEEDVYVALPAKFNDKGIVDQKSLCLKLNKRT